MEVQKNFRLEDFGQVINLLLRINNINSYKQYVWFYNMLYK